VTYTVLPPFGDEEPIAFESELEARAHLAIEIGEGRGRSEEIGLPRGVWISHGGAPAVFVPPAA
jgi:hypothetical protein